MPRSLFALIIIALCLLIAGGATTVRAAEIVLINDGQTHALPIPGAPSTAPADFVVRDAGCGTPENPYREPCVTGGAPTRVTFGSFANHGGSLIVRDRSAIVVDGVDLSGSPHAAFIGGVVASGSSHVDVKSGRLGGVLLLAYATATITGGATYDGRPISIGLANASHADLNASVEGITLRNSSSATLRGSGVQAWVQTSGEFRIEGGALDTLLGHAGTITVESGAIQSLSLDGSAYMSVRGGIPHASGLQPMTLSASSRLTLTGVAFRLNGLPIEPGTVAVASGHLEVTYANGLSYGTQFVREPTALLVLVPEPSAALLVALGLTAIGLSGDRRDSPG